MPVRPQPPFSAFCCVTPMLRSIAMTRILIYGIISSFFFSSTYVLNRAASLEGGHWVWTSSIRYFFMFFLLIPLVWAMHGRHTLVECFRELRRHPLFWLASGTIGMGLFYAPFCYGSMYAPGWVIAVTFMMTIFLNLLVLKLFGKSVPVTGILFLLMVFAGIVIVNVDQAGDLGLSTILVMALPLAVGGFAFPFGNQMVAEAMHGGHGRIPSVASPAMEFALARLFMMTAGSLPFFILLILFTAPGLPSGQHVAQIFGVALLSGICGTAIFLSARHRAKNGYEVAMMDATQALEIVYTIVLEAVLLGAAWPAVSGWVGSAMVVLGLGLSSLPRFQK